MTQFSSNPNPAPSNLTLRQKVAFYLDDIETPIGQLINLVLTIAIVLSVVLFVAQTYALPPRVSLWLSDLDNGILYLFVAEYGLRLWCAERRVRYVFSVYALIDLAAILPLFLGFLDIKFVRLLRGFRILRLARFLEGHIWRGQMTSEDSVILARIIFTLFSIIFVYSGFIYQVEHAVNPEAFRTFLDAFYFAAVTMTTVGYGDVTPVSEMGRLLTVMMILTGIALIPTQLGELIRRLVKIANKVRVTCPTCQLSFHDLDAQFCKACGTRLPKPEASPKTST